jgi:flagellar hook protein FlgE
MSINSAMLAGASGMRANASALAAISDNISNVNTVGYKRVRNDFVSLLDAGTGSSSHSAGGVLAAHSQLISEQGAPQSSSVATHLAISGAGFFAVRNNSTIGAASDPLYFTRAGQFGPDESGYLKNSAGFYLQGWPVNAAGQVTASPTDLGDLEPIRVSGVVGGASATSAVSVSANLRSSLPVSAAAATYNAATNNMASGAVTPDFQAPIQIYDSRGGLRSLTVSFLKQGPNTWYAEIHLPASDVVAGGGLVNGQLATGVVRFTPFGQIDPATSTLPSSVTINQNGTGAGPQWAAGLGLASQTISIDLDGSSSIGGLTSFDADSVLNDTETNGTPFGSLSSVEVGEDGSVNALFSNGQVRRVYQVPLATFDNPDSLMAEQKGVFRVGTETGDLSLKSAGTLGAGDIRPRALESSTVDLAEEFSNLIITQRAYSASSKIITTADEMLDELIRLKR